jgi:threonine aldolase
LSEAKFQFASDNTAGICPEAWAAMQAANAGYVPSYGDDQYTTRAADLFREIFETDCDVYFVFNGTAANSLALASLCQSYHSVICHDSAHVETDECGAPEFFSNGTKLLTAQGPHGKLDRFEVERIVTARSDVHYPKPRVISITQATESGTVYRLDEIHELAELARRYKLHLHMDGARFANAVASAGVSPKAMTWQAGVDVLCFGGTKNGMAVGDAVVFFNRGLSEEFEYRCKQAGQLASKMRFLAAPWVAMLEDGAWLRYAGHANRLARFLGEEVQRVPGVRLLHPVEASGVFAEMPDRYHEGLKERGWLYYRFIGGGARLMCSWQTTESDIAELMRDLRAVAA